MSTFAHPAAVGHGALHRDPPIGLVISLEPGTCSDRATSHFCDMVLRAQPPRAHASSFTHAAEMAKANPAAILLAPHLHPICAHLSMAADWVSLDELAFSLPNPPLYLARRAGAAAQATDRRCATIAPLRPLIDTTDADGTPALALVDVQTTQAAARMCVSGEVAFCVTNQHGLDAHRLTAVRRLKQITVWWIPFQYRPTGGNNG